MSTVGKSFPLEEEYKKPTGIRPEDIEKLRLWLNTQPHLPGNRITDLDLILTYHCCDRSPEVSKQLLDAHFTSKTMFTSFFKDRSFDAKIKNACDMALMTPLPTRTKEGYAVFYTQYLDADTHKFVFADIIRLMMMVVDLWQYEEGTWPGFVLVANLGDMAFAHITKLDLPSLQQYAYYLQNALLVNLKGFHIINAPGFFDTILSIIQPFIRNALLDMVFVHQVGSNTIEKHYPKDALPKEAGGKYKSVAECKQDMLRKLQANEEYFVAENKKRVVETLRAGRPKTISDFFGGVEGSFKQLEVD